MSAELPAALIAANADPSIDVVRAYIGPGPALAPLVPWPPLSPPAPSW